MALDATKVAVQGTGAYYVAPLGSTLPTNATGAIDAAFLELGYVSEDGLTESEGITTQKIKAHQNGDVVRTVQTEHDLTYKFTALESNTNVLNLKYPSGQITGAQRVGQAWVFHMVDGAKKVRIVVPNGQITDLDDVAFKNGEATDYGFTITAYPDSSGVKAYVYRA